MKNKIVILLALAVVTGLAFFTATEASADCLQEGPLGCEKYVTENGWTMEIDHPFPLHCDGTTDGPEGKCLNQQGRRVTGYRFGYLITAPGANANLVQALSAIVNMNEDNAISVVYPPSVKILDCEPTTKFGCDLTKIFVLSWDALKLDPFNQTIVAAFTTRAGAEETAARLKTGDGIEEVTRIMGLSGCNITANDSAITIGSTTAKFDECTGQFIEVTSSSAQVESVPGGLYIGYADITGTDNGWFDLTEDDVFMKNWTKIKTMGRVYGAFMDVAETFSHTDNDGIPDEYSGKRYFAYGNEFYMHDVNNLPLPPLPGPGASFPECTTGAGLREQEIEFNGQYKVKYNKDGDICEVSGPDVENIVVKHFLDKADSRGRRSNDPKPVVNSGGNFGVVIDGSWACSRYGWGCR
jgi:hypothetical protein